jgi:hypothetical protein
MNSTLDKLVENAYIPLYGNVADAEHEKSRGELSRNSLKAFPGFFGGIHRHRRRGRL